MAYPSKNKNPGGMPAFLATTSSLALLFSLIFCNGNAFSGNPPESPKKSSTAATAGAPVKRVLVFGRVSSDPKRHYRLLKPMADYVAAHMRDLGIVEAKVLMARDSRQMIDYLKQGKIDWVTETPFSAEIFQDEAGAEILLRRWKSGVSEYFSIFFARKDSGIHSLDELVGKIVAFEDEHSTSAYSVPASILIGKGMKLVKLASPREKPPADKVGYVFAGQPINTTAWVYKGFVQAGAYSNLDWDNDENLARALRGELQIFYTSKRFPRAIELVRKDLAPQIKQRMKEILINAYKDPAAKPALLNFENTAKFDELDKDAWQGLDEARRLTKIIRSEPK